MPFLLIPRFLIPRVALDRVFSNTAMKQRSVVPRSFPYLDVLDVYIVFLIERLCSRYWTYLSHIPSICLT